VKLRAQDIRSNPVAAAGQLRRGSDVIAARRPLPGSFSRETARRTSDVGITLDAPRSSGSAVVVKVQIVSGSKPAPDSEGEEKPLGGLKGGHVVINLGPEGVLGFSNTTRGTHLFSKRKHKNSKFEHYSEAQWEEKIKGKQVVSFDIVMTAEQRDAVKRSFEGKPPVDYSVAGYRCASYALRALEDAGVIEASRFSVKYLLAPTPTAMIRFLERQGYEPQVQEGAKTRIWNRRFKGADAPAPAPE
jgi:hypothetical protein